FAAHDDAFAGCRRFEPCEIFRQMPRQLPANADDVVLGDGGNKGDHRLNGDRRLDGVVTDVILQREILVFETEDVFYIRVDLHDRQRVRLARQLQIDLLDVVAVNMDVAERVDELAQFQIADLRNHHGQQRIRGDVERHTQKHVG